MKIERGTHRSHGKWTIKIDGEVRGVVTRERDEMDTRRGMRSYRQKHTVFVSFGENLDDDDNPCWRSEQGDFRTTVRIHKMSEAWPEIVRVIQERYSQ